MNCHPTRVEQLDFAGRVAEITALTPAQNRIITRRKREYFNRLREHMNLLKSEGKLQDVDTTAATFSLLGMISWLSRWFR